MLTIRLIDTISETSIEYRHNGSWRNLENIPKNFKFRWMDMQRNKGYNVTHIVNNQYRVTLNKAKKK